MMDRAAFYASLRKSTLFDHGLSQRQVTGFEAILDAWVESEFSDDRWLAYILATTYHETGRAMYPVREGGLGKGHPYGVAVNGQVYYGRGFVQITWLANYQKADAALALGGKLVADADLALDPKTAAKILLRGMTEAWFTKFKLSDYLNATTADYLHCRRIVNGMDQASVIAGYALIFYAAITAGEHSGADITASRPATTVAAPVVPLPSSDGGSAADPVSEIVGEITSAATSAISTIVPGGPSPAGSTPPSATITDSPMNPLVAISIIQQVMTYAPQIEHIITNVPDIIAKGQDAIARLEKMDFATAVTDVEAICTDLGLSQQMLATVISHATAAAPPAPVTTAAKS